MHDGPGRHHFAFLRQWPGFIGVNDVCVPTFGPAADVEAGMAPSHADADARAVALSLASAA